MKSKCLSEASCHRMALVWCCMNDMTMSFPPHWDSLSPFTDIISIWVSHYCSLYRTKRTRGAKETEHFLSLWAFLNIDLKYINIDVGAAVGVYSIRRICITLGSHERWLLWDQMTVKTNSENPKTFVIIELHVNVTYFYDFKLE